MASSFIILALEVEGIGDSKREHIVLWLGVGAMSARSVMKCATQANLVLVVNRANENNNMQSWKQLSTIGQFLAIFPICSIKTQFGLTLCLSN